MTLLILIELIRDMKSIKQFFSRKKADYSFLDKTILEAINGQLTTNEMLDYFDFEGITYNIWYSRIEYLVEQGYIQRDMNYKAPDNRLILTERGQKMVSSIS